MPENVPAKTKLILVKDYFENVDGFRFPKLMKQLKNEDDPTYEARVKNYLLCQSDEQFTQVGDLIDPDDPHQTVFLELYTEVQSDRVNCTEKPNCGIF